jgi:hypothetical protein
MYTSYGGVFLERTQIYFDKAEKDSLMKLAKKRGVTMAEVVREAVAEYITKEQESVLVKLDESHGIWQDRVDISDSDEFVSGMRQMWLKEEDK